MKTPTFIPIEDAAKRLGVSCESVAEWIRSGNLEARERDGQMCVAEDDVADSKMVEFSAPFVLRLRRTARRASLGPIDSLAILREVRDED